MSNGLLKPEGVAEILGLNKSSIYWRLKRGMVPGAFKFGGRWYIHKDIFNEKLREMGMEGIINETSD